MHAVRKVSLCLRADRLTDRLTERSDGRSRVREEGREERRKGTTRKRGEAADREGIPSVGFLSFPPPTNIHLSILLSVWVSVKACRHMKKCCRVFLSLYGGNGTYVSLNPVHPPPSFTHSFPTVDLNVFFPPPPLAEFSFRLVSFQHSGRPNCLPAFSPALSGKAPSNVVIFRTVTFAWREACRENHASTVSTERERRPTHRQMN
mmetsp:Transcript_13619/g.27055  ORF Transcript_13619/g.27055 Transcript_13619/m.27055 type:complete len:205 (-) Transcript_13619:346-960(-)